MGTLLAIIICFIIAYMFIGLAAAVTASLVFVTNERIDKDHMKLLIVVLFAWPVALGMIVAYDVIDRC